MTEFTKEQLAGIVNDNGDRSHLSRDLAAFAFAQMKRAENAEKRMKAWGCPDEDFICLNCGRETPCMTEADIKPGDPGVPCTFDLTYPQMIERLHYHEDQQRCAEAERDRLKGELAEAEEAIRYFATKVDLARPAKFHPIDTRRTVIFSCKADGTWNHDPVCSSAVRRAMERGK